MIKLIKINGIDNYFVDTLTNEIIEKYDHENKHLNLIAKLEDGSVLTVHHDQIVQKYGGQIVFEYSENKYIIDDGYQNLLIRGGYIVLNKYDNINNFIDNRIEGTNIRNNLFDYVRSNISLTEDQHLISIKDNPQSLEIQFIDDENDLKYTICLDSINNIVSKNQQRKSNDLPYYPFLKSMDKYGTLYLSIFVQKIVDTDDFNKKYEVAEQFISGLIQKLNKNATDNNQYRFERTIIRKRINYTEGI